MTAVWKMLYPLCVLFGINNLASQIMCTTQSCKNMKPFDLNEYRIR